MLLLVLFFTSASATSVTHNPPIANQYSNLSAVFDNSSLTNNGVYNGSYVADSEYGVYNFCNMPHVRASEYATPELGFELQYVEVIHRHHKRTPYQSNTFPEENLQLSCSGTQMFYYGHVINRPEDNVPVGWNSYQEPSNPFAYIDPGFNGLCQFPQISDGGLNDSFVHGQDLFGNYHTNLNFLSDSYNSSEVQFYATNNVITSQVAGALVKGMFPGNNELVIVNVQRDASDSLEPGLTCAGADLTKSLIYKEDGWVKHLNESESLYSELDLISGVDPTDSGWHQSWDHYFDNLAHRTCHGFDLPCNGSRCITENEAFQVFRLGDYEYNYLYRVSPNSTYYSVARYGPWLVTLKDRLLNAVSGNSVVKYRHNIAHDGSLSPLLGALQIEYLRWPGMGAEVVFELWKKPTDGTQYVRILYGGQPLRTSGPLGTADMISYEQFDAFLDSLVGGNSVTGRC